MEVQGKKVELDGAVTKDGNFIAIEVKLLGPGITDGIQLWTTRVLSLVPGMTFRTYTLIVVVVCTDDVAPLPSSLERLAKKKCRAGL